MSSKRSSHAAKTASERGEYIRAVVGDTVEKVDTSGTRTSSAGMPDTPKAGKKRPTSLEYKAKEFFEDHWRPILSGLIGAIILGVSGFVWTEYARLNREVGEISIKVAGLDKGADKTEKITDQVPILSAELSTIRFQIDQLWERVFKSKPNKPITKN